MDSKNASIHNLRDTRQGKIGFVLCANHGVSPSGTFDRVCYFE